jgi:hypothetical protein
LLLLSEIFENVGGRCKGSKRMRAIFQSLLMGCAVLAMGVPSIPAQ